MKKTLTALALLATSTLSAQSQTDANAERLVATQIASSRAYDTLAYLTDNIGPRLSGSKGADLAVKWAVAQFKQWGIDVRTEKVMVPHWVRGVERASLPSHNDQKIVLTALGGSVATRAEGLTAEVIEVSSFDELKALGNAKVRGKIVFFNNPMDMTLIESGHAFEAYSKAVVFRGVGASRAAELGAVAAVIRSVGSASLRTPHTGSLRYDAAQPKIPAAAMTPEDAMLVHRLIAKGEKVRMHLVLTPKELPDVESANVIAEIRGSQYPEEIVLMGAHLDSWDLGTGAIDDGSGVAMIMESLRMMKELGIRPKRTVRAVLYMNEENGLNGGKTYFENRKDTELSKHVAAIESDAGASAPTGFRTTLKEPAIALLRARTRVLERIGALNYENATQTGADTSPLTNAGVPGFGLVPEPRHYFDYHHTPADTLDKIDPKELAQSTAAIAALAYVIADSDVYFRN